MHNNTGKPTSGNIIAFAQQVDAVTQFKLACSGYPGQRVLDHVLSNPKFSTPANDEPDLPRLAPRSRDCRKARLLSMWIDIIAEDDLATY